MEREYFKKTRHGLVWSRTGTFSVRQRFALAWPPGLNPVNAGLWGVLIALMVPIVIMLFDGTAGEPAQPGATLETLGVFAVGFTVGAVPAIIAGRTIRAMKQDRSFRFGEMLDDGMSSPSYEVVRVFLGLPNPGSSHPADVLRALSNWLADTWEQDSCWLEDCQFNRETGQHYLNSLYRWHAVRNRIESFRAVPELAAASGVDDALRNLLERQEEWAVSTTEREISVRAGKVQGATRDHDEAVAALAQFRRDVATAANE